MLKKLSIILTIPLLIIGIQFVNQTNAAAAFASPKKDQVIISLLNPYINEQVLKIYGKPTQYSIAEAELLSISQDINGDVSFEIIVKIKTFVGPHNPPYGDDTFKFLVTPSSVKLLDFNHIKSN